MSNVNHRYSSESWTLDLSGKRSPLSRWTGQEVLRDEQFRLSLLGAQGGIAPVVWLSGDRPCFEELHKVVEAYVQQGLGELVLAGQSTFPAGSQGDPALTSSSPKATAPSASNGSSSQFSLEALGLLRHNLNYSPSDSSSPRQMQLSTLQLADLLAVLDQWQTETLALPESKARLRVLPGGKDDFVMPTWGRIAASLMVALGATGLGGYILSQRLSGVEQQVAMESINPATEGAPPPNADVNSAFGSFPTASGPPITSQAQDGDAPFNNPFVQPQDEQATPPSDPPALPPDVTFPTPMPSDLGQIPLPPATPTIPSGDLQAGLPTTTANTQSSVSPPADSTVGTEAEVASPGQGQVAGGGNLIDNSKPSNELPAIATAPQAVDSPLLEDYTVSTSANDIAEEDFSAPPLTEQPNTEIAAFPSEKAKATADAEGNSSPTDGAVASPPVGTSTASRVGQPPSAVAKPPAAIISPEPDMETATAPAAPPAPQVTVASPLPANSQSRAVQSYLQSQWKPPAAIQQPLQYRLSVSPEGKLSSLEALSPTAQLYMNDANLPSVGSAIGGAADTVQSTMVVTMTPSGQVNVALEKATPAP